MKIKLQPLDEAKILAAAKEKFPNADNHLDQCDLFMKDVSDGTYTCNFLDHPIYISTQYAYEDILVNENQTRYKLHVSTLELKKAPYSVNYSWNDCYYAIYEEDDQIQFMKYPLFLDFIKNQIQVME